MISYFQAFVLGTLQGVAELFPISSLGHNVVLPSVLGWHIDQTHPDFVGFVVLTHLATALVLLAFFWSDWVCIAKGVIRSLRQRVISEKDTYAKLGWLIVVSTVPVGVLGILFEKTFTQLFGAPKIVAAALMLNGLVLFAAERLRARAPRAVDGDEALAKLTWKQAIYIGLMQCVALVPGFSRTGLTMTGGLVHRLSHENAARYAFLLATPVIFAAAVLEVPHLFLDGGVAVGPSLFGAVCSGAAAYFSIRFLTKYFETKTLTPFALYCVCTGAAFLLLM